jgi:plastocyanin
MKLMSLMAAAALVLVACGGDAGETSVPPPSSGTTVVLKDLVYQPAELTIAAGETVTWVWDDGDIQHDVVGDGFATELITEGEFSHTFTEPGSYPYICTIHPTMTGTITVLP